MFRAENQQRALELGIGIVYQELRLCPNLTVVENIFLGHELRTPRRRLNWPEMSARARSLLDSLGSAVAVSRKVKALSIAEQQIVEIAKVIAQRAEVLILDEPTSALALTETENLLGTIRRLNREGVTILYISHRMEEIFAISDRISVLRDGRYLGTLRTVDSQPERVVEMIAGEKLTKGEHHYLRPSRRADEIRRCHRFSTSTLCATEVFQDPTVFITKRGGYR